MSAYRFCRTDDIPLLVEAYASAFAPHFDPPRQLDIAGFKGWIRDLDLWCSSCMVAADGSELIGVLIGAKRPTKTLIIAIGVHPDHLRRSHGRHLLDSLSSKLAILGPPTLLAEVPAEDARACAFFEACGYSAGSLMADFLLPAGVAAGGTMPDAFVSVSFDDLVASDALSPDAPRCWQREVSALAARKSDLQGLALASPDRIEAWILWRERGLADGAADAEREIMAIGAAPGDTASAILGLLVRQFAARDGRPARLARVREDELPWPWLEQAGFRRGALHRNYSATARPA